MLSKLLSGLSAILDTIKSGFDKVVEFFSFLLEFITGIYEYLLNWAEKLFFHFLEWFCDFVNPIGHTLAESFPDINSVLLSYKLPGAVLGFANTVINLDLAVELFTSWITFMAIYIAVKLTIKMIPMIG